MSHKNYQAILLTSDDNFYSELHVAKITKKMNP